jgi:hypothetical protein
MWGGWHYQTNVYVRQIDENKQNTDASTMANAWTKTPICTIGMSTHKPVLSI